MNKVLNWMKKHKKLMILVLVLAILLTAFLVIRSKAKEAMAALTELTEETAFVERRSIQSSISSTGEIISDNTRNIAATLTGYEVLTVNVEVGDIVSEGDVLCVFDTEDLEESLEDAEDALSAARTQSKVAVNNAERALEMAIETKNYQIETAARNIINAHNGYEKASDSYDELRSQLKEAEDNKNKAAADLAAVSGPVEDTAEYKAWETAQKAYEDALVNYNAFIPDGENDETEQEALYKVVSDAEVSLKAAETALNSLNLEGRRAAAEAAYAAAEKAYNTIESSLSTAENAVDSAWLAVQNAQAAYDYTVASQESSFRGSKDALKSAEAGPALPPYSRKAAWTA